jgi:hypothetical protein
MRLAGYVQIESVQLGQFLMLRMIAVFCTLVYHLKVLQAFSSLAVCEDLIGSDTVIFSMPELLGNESRDFANIRFQAGPQSNNKSPKKQPERRRICFGIAFRIDHIWSRLVRIGARWSIWLGIRLWSWRWELGFAM